jgi:hypothetical protein
VTPVANALDQGPQHLEPPGFNVSQPPVMTRSIIKHKEVQEAKPEKKKKNILMPLLPIHYLIFAYTPPKKKTCSCHFLVGVFLGFVLVLWLL